MAILLTPSTPGGSNQQIQFNDNGSFGGDVDLTYNKTTNLLTTGGDIRLEDGGTFTTTLQVVSPTANRVMSFPDATGTIALVSGTNGQLIYNNNGVYGGLTTLTADSSGSITLSGRLNNTYTSISDNPASRLTGAWFSGGTSSTTKPHFLIEPSGTSSTNWNTFGTGLGVNAPNNFSGDIVWLGVNGTSIERTSATGVKTISGTNARIEINRDSQNFDGIILSRTGTGAGTNTFSVSTSGGGSITALSNYSINCGSSALGSFTVAYRASGNTPIHRFTCDSVYLRDVSTPADRSTVGINTLTVGDMKNGIITSNQTGGAITIELPTGTIMDTGFSSPFNNQTFEWSIINQSNTQPVAISTSVGHSFIGNSGISTNSAARFATRRTTTATFITYRIS
jgi:hypothetical protein